MNLSDITIVGSYDYRLVALSVFIATLASYAALDLSGRVTSAHGRARLIWLSWGAVAMGIGIWSMHYIGMLAFRLPVPVQYDWPTVLFSLLAAVFASAVALFVVSRRKMGLFRATVGSSFMGGGIAAMHYVGMAAMRLPAMCHYSAALVSLTVVLAIVISFVALWLTFHFRGDNTAGGWPKTVSALAMGAAIPIMHYTGMTAVRFVPALLSQRELAHSVSISFLGGAGIIVVTFMVLGLVFLTSLVDRRFTVQALELESSEQRYRQIVEAALDSYIGTDSDGIITDWNVQAETTFGWSRSEAIGQSLYQTIVPNRHRDEHQRIVDELLASAEASVMKKRVETTRLHRDGHEFPVELSISVIRAGETHRVGAFLRDITDRKQSEQELTAAKESAEAGSRAKSEFLANMSHEIRTPLNGVIGMTDLALGTDLTSEQREYLETVRLSADSLLTVINDILDFSKIEAGKVDLEFDEFNLRDSLEATLKTLALRADQKGLELLCEIASSVPDVVRGDSNRLRQVLFNLVGNAIKFTGKGEVALNVHVEAEDGDDRTLHFTVSDSGIGIPPEKQKLIFQPFAQADNSTTRKYGGTGLGLTISKRLVGLMEGKMWVESEAGRGSQFHFTALFKTPKKPIEVRTIAQPEMLRGVRVSIVDDNGARDPETVLHVLVAEDNAVNQRLAVRMLEKRGHRVVVANNGHEVLDALAKDMFDLVLMDVQMPEIDGFQATTEIREKEKGTGRHQIVIAVTAHAMRGDQERCLAAGMDGYLVKPIRPQALDDVLEKHLTLRTESEANATS
jgi:two-component system sensor histidine kinase/response regulator